jgi:prepilin-type N-terminal cleavage/methylation domain-containing protein
MKLKKGFTLVELLLVIAIIAIVFAFSAPYTIRFYQTNLVEDTSNNIVSVLNKAKHNAVLQKNDSSFGVHFDLASSSYTLFQGSDYLTDRDETQDEVYSIPGGISFDGLEDIVFSKLTGLTSTTSTTTLVYEDLESGILIQESGDISRVD